MPFPTGFLWGVSESAFQFEMGDRLRRFIDPNTDWWWWVREPSNIESGLVSGDLPEDGINYAELYSHDHDLAKSLGLNTYRLNIEWSRVFPCSTRHVEVDVERDGLGLIKSVKIDSDTLLELDALASRRAVELYKSILTDLRKKGFRVIVNLLHFTIPVWLHDPIVVRSSNLAKGPRGLVDEAFVVEFAKFAAYIAWKFGDLVDMWSTFNEPLVMVELGYLFPEAGFPPGVRSVEAARDALVNVIVAHARAYDAIKRWDRRRVKGAPEEVVKVGIIHNIIPVHPASPSDEEAAAKLDYLHNRLILDAVTKGGAPLSMKRGELLSVSHLSGKLDWIGVNYYTRAVARASESAPSPFENLGVYLAPGYGSLCSPNSESRDGYPCSDFGWEIYPRGIAEALDIASSYGLPTMITENGVADSRDVYRPMFVVRHLATLESYLESGGRAMGYLHWALTDNYEWAKGFRMRFGLVEVDLASKERRPRPSAFIYAKIASENTVPRSLREQYGALDA